MNSKTNKNGQPIMSHGPSIADLRTAIDKAEADGVARADMVLRLTFRDASLIKRSPSVGLDEVSFADGEMRFVGVRAWVGPVLLSSLEAPALPDPLPPEAPAKKTKAKAKPKAKVGKAAKDEVEADVEAEPAEA